MFFIGKELFLHGAFGDHNNSVTAFHHPLFKVAEEADGGIVVQLSEPLTGVAKGQAVVLYRPDEAGDIVIGSGTIAGTSSDRP